MAIKQYRIDGRMLHGQSTQYGKLFSIDEYIVINEAVSKDDLQISLLELVAPSCIVRVLSPADACHVISGGEFHGTNTLVVFKEVEDAVELLELGVKMPAIQVGGMFAKKGRERRQYDVTLFADEQDCAAFRKLENAGVELSYQVVPDYKEKKLSSMIKY